MCGVHSVFVCVCWGCVCVEGRVCVCGVHAVFVCVCGVHSVFVFVCGVVPCVCVCVYVCIMCSDAVQ